MPFTPEQSAIKVTKSLEEQIAGANSQSEISALLRAAAVAQGAAQPDAFDHNVLHETGRTLPTRVAKVVRINGVAHPLEADSPQELSAKEAALFRELFGGDQQQVEQPRDPQTGQFVSQDEPNALDAAHRVELELAFKRGDVSTEEYLERSGAMQTFLQSHGVDISALQTVSNAVFERSWADATDAFLQNHPDWIGGDQKKNVIGEIIQQAGWTEAVDKVQALEAAYKYAQDNNLLVANPEIEAQDALASARTSEELQRALDEHYRKPAGSSGFFGR